MSKYSQCTDTYEKINGAVLYGMLHFFNFYLVRENPKTPIIYDKENYYG